MRALMNRVSARPSTANSEATCTPSSSNIFPGLRKLDLASDSAAAPLLTLTLSAPSFLDSVVRDDFSSTPLYIIETRKERTTVHRCGPEVHSIAKLQWPTATKMASANAVALSGIAVQMHGGRWRPTEEFMKFGSLFTSRKFHIPHHPHSLKWKRVGPSYNCTCSSVKGPVAVLEAAVLSAPPRLKIYASLLRETDSTRAQPNFGGVPYALMDYLVATSLILVTDIEEWMHRPEEDVEAARTAMEAFLPDSMRNWRKYRSSYVSSSHSHSPSDSILHIPGTNTGWGDDSRSMISDTGTTPSPATSTHPYSFWQMNSSNIPPVPQVPAEHQSALSPLSRSATLGSRRRQLPLPPGQLTPSPPQPRIDQPWLLDRPPSASEPSTSGSSERDSAGMQLRLVSPLSTTPPPASVEFSPRSSGSINRRQLPQQRAPPHLPVPLVPKLMGEYFTSPQVMPSQEESPTEGGPSRAEGDDYMQEEHNVAPEQIAEETSYDQRPRARDTIYELPPPAYDAIDFSMPRPPLTDLPPNFQSFSISHQPSPQLTESS